MSKLPVIELFGPTIQGEGSVIGLKTMFVRLYGCDYKCSWCDSAFTWDGSNKPNIKLLTSTDLIKQLNLSGLEGCTYVTISGGNPALYKEPIHDLVTALHNISKKVIVETQGSIWQEWFNEIDILTISPKPPSSKMITNWESLQYIFDNLNHSNVSLKVVIFDELDYEYAKKVHKIYPLVPLFLQVGNSEVTSNEDVSRQLLKKLEWLFDLVISDSDMQTARVLPQLHTLIWNNERGR
ncbi:7-carboxy-7-deazaguanine synthase QueE [Paenibacillus sp. 37]|uniref:7-carboxy-7-deazaguanine synthase QueE n=1 Tax=Paenibacillus sp. 37 TaxID=2607911 RepID=UPI00122E346A|nr:7-carboxy-7-deazaguanine synthase QueE [Paenibacillus sp. 37]